MINIGRGRFAGIFMTAFLFAAPTLADGLASGGETRPLAAPVSGDHLSRIRGETHADILADVRNVDLRGTDVGVPGAIVTSISRSSSAIAHARLVQFQTDVSMTAR